MKTCGGSGESSISYINVYTKQSSVEGAQNRRSFVAMQRPRTGHMSLESGPDKTVNALHGDHREAPQERNFDPSPRRPTQFRMSPSLFPRLFARFALAAVGCIRPCLFTHSFVGWTNFAASDVYGEAFSRSLFSALVSRFVARSVTSATHLFAS
jgi:hypothetical protein